MVFKVIGLIIIIGSVSSRIHEKESEQYLLDRPGNENSALVNFIRLYYFYVDSEKDSAALNPQCMLRGCAKRSMQDDVGPFWANRGKKDPNYRTEPLSAEEPHWVLVRRAEDDVTPFKYNFEPFFVTRGKKDKNLQEEDKNIIQELFAKMRIQNHHDTELLKNEE
ncbi:hypothetical protein FQR65_LT04314 [Abscondita terminalis]|nr:hypothetical protein FQR65_LT04314 [Abscondita terminalis]